MFFFHKKHYPSRQHFFYVQPSHFPCVTDTVGAMNTLIRERHNDNGSCITLKVSRRLKQEEIYLSNEETGLAFSSTQLGHIFGSDIANEFGLMLKGKWPHKPEFAY